MNVTKVHWQPRKIESVELTLSAEEITLISSTLSHKWANMTFMRKDSESVEFEELTHAFRKLEEDIDRKEL